MAGTIPLSMTQQFNEYGEPLSGGKLYIIQVGTVSTPQNAYLDTDLSIALPYPITLDAAGRIPPFFLADGFVKIRLQDSSGVVQLSADSVMVIGPSSGGGGGSTVDSTQLIQTGMMMFAHTISSIAGFVRLNGRTVGSASSGATERPNADTQALFLYLWPDTALAVSGGRGANAAADWTANKTLALPDWRGYTLGALDDMGNTAANRLEGYFTNPTVLGSAGGTPKVALAVANLPPYSPVGSLAITTTLNNGTTSNFNGSSQSGGTQVSGNATVPITAVSVGTFTGAAQGGASTAFAIINPRKNITFYIKL